MKKKQLLTRKRGLQMTGMGARIWKWKGMVLRTEEKSKRSSNNINVTLTLPLNGNGTQPESLKRNMYTNFKKESSGTSVIE